MTGQLAALTGEGLAIQKHTAGGGLHQPAQQAQQAGFAAAVGAADLHHVTCAQPQFEVLEQQAPVTLASQRHGFKNGDRHGDLLFSSSGTAVQVGIMTAVILMQLNGGPPTQSVPDYTYPDPPPRAQIYRVGI